MPKKKEEEESGNNDTNGCGSMVDDKTNVHSRKYEEMSNTNSMYVSAIMWYLHTQIR